MSSSGHTDCGSTRERALGRSGRTLEFKSGIYAALWGFVEAKRAPAPFGLHSFCVFLKVAPPELSQPPAQHVPGTLKALGV